VNALPQDDVNFVGMPLQCFYAEGPTGIPQVTYLNPSGRNRYFVEFRANRIIVRAYGGKVILSRVMR
jgi:hypothetical protein